MPWPLQTVARELSAGPRDGVCFSCKYMKYVCERSKSVENQTVRTSVNLSCVANRQSPLKPQSRVVGYASNFMPRTIIPPAGLLPLSMPLASYHLLICLKIIATLIRRPDCLDD